MQTAIRSNSPNRDLSPEHAIVCDWLAANGIDELIPENPTFMIEDDERITYRAFKFAGDERGYENDKIADGYLRVLEEDRVVPVVVPLTDEVRAAFEVLESAEMPAYLFEVHQRGVLAEKADAYRRRLGLA